MNVGDTVKVVNIPGITETAYEGREGRIIRITGDLVRIFSLGKEIVVVKRRVQKI